MHVLLHFSCHFWFNPSEKANNNIIIKILTRHKHEQRAVSIYIFIINLAVNDGEEEEGG